MPATNAYRDHANQPTRSPGSMNTSHATTSAVHTSCDEPTSRTPGKPVFNQRRNILPTHVCRSSVLPAGAATRTRRYEEQRRHALEMGDWLHDMITASTRRLKITE